MARSGTSESEAMEAKSRSKTVGQLLGEVDDHFGGPITAEERAWARKRLGSSWPMPAR
ncbi:MAG TPA: hypothetical protein VNS19_04830 [Acidimicrobiales bacterium]|nr:hypothetical protein [Acidimicrobiales bacterium]